MDRMKTFFKYALWIILFFIFSEILINLNLETTYKEIGRKDTLKQINVYQAEATKINGRIKGTIFNETENKIKENYLKIDLYSPRNNLLGTRYIELANLRDNETREFEAYFKLQDVKYYEMSFVDEKDPTWELPQMFKDLTVEQVRFGTLLTYLIFWM